MKAPLSCGRKKPNQTQSSTHLNWKTTLEKFLATQGLRSTTQRNKVAEIALSQNSHFEIQTLIKKIQAVHSDISPATVYRTVNTLCEAGLLNETFQSNTGVTLYESHDLSHHDHVVCLDCGEIFEFHDEGIEDAQLQAIKKMNFTQARHQHVIYAHCTYSKKK